jgi:uncharacterized protein YutE (UPF0331/DUF86 family)
MSPSKINEKVISGRIGWITNMIARIKELPLTDFNSFINDKRNIASAESYLRRAIEGRHILAKGFGKSAGEYKEIAVMLHEAGILDENGKSILSRMAGYRNRMVHYYNEISDKELFDICSNKLSDINIILNYITKWINNNPDKIDRSL